jgi:hypothetical protein
VGVKGVRVLHLREFVLHIVTYIKLI